MHGKQSAEECNDDLFSRQKTPGGRCEILQYYLTSAFCLLCQFVLSSLFISDYNPDFRHLPAIIG